MPKRAVHSHSLRINPPLNPPPKPWRCRCGAPSSVPAEPAVRTVGTWAQLARWALQRPLVPLLTTYHAPTPPPSPLPGPASFEYYGSSKPSKAIPGSTRRAQHHHDNTHPSIKHQAGRSCRQERDKPAKRSPSQHPAPTAPAQHLHLPLVFRGQHPGSSPGRLIKLSPPLPRPKGRGGGGMCCVRRAAAAPLSAALVVKIPKHAPSIRPLGSEGDEVRL